MDLNVAQLFDTHGINGIDLSRFGWNVTFDWEPPIKCKPITTPRIHQTYGFVLPAIRYFFYVYRKKKKEGKKPFIDCLNPIGWRPIYGVPMGGIGGGAINRGYRGEFCRYSLVPGIYEYKEVSGNQFIVTVQRRGSTVYQQVLSVHKAPEDCPQLNCWNWQFPKARAAYIGLFPRSWTVYDLPEQKVKLYCRQISPVIPHDYRDSCLPLCLFEWTAINYGKEEISVSITCIIRNGTGIIENAAQGLKSTNLQSELFQGCCLNQKIRDMNCCYGLAVMKTEGVSVSSCASILISGIRNDKNIPGPLEFWKNLMDFGDLSNITNIEQKCNKDLAIATCAKVSVRPMSKSENMRFVFLWNMPSVHFRDGVVQYRRRYARWFDYENLELGCSQMISHAFKQMESWEQKIRKWQDPILQNERYPFWYKSALFNELYFIVDGGTVWLDQTSPLSVPIDGDNVVPRNKHKMEYGIFGYLEGHEYRMFNTYDVHHYSSWALVSLWPKLQETIQYDFADATRFLDSSSCFYIHKGTWESRSDSYAIPHDAGDPEEEPFLKYNAYMMYNTDQWKDLNPKFVLQIYRDWILLKNEDYLKYMLPIAKEVMNKSLKWDKDDDGIIENSGFADQTYDAWKSKGVSAYTGGLWLSALYAICQMFKHLNMDCSLFQDILKKGKKSFEAKLWTGSFFKYDEHNPSIMADQLCGHWYLKSCGIQDNEVFDRDKIRTTLLTIYQKNYVSLGMKLGACNGCFMDGSKDTSSVQSEEFWVGVNYALAATMILEKCEDEGWTIAENVYKTVYERYGLQFQTPEAYFDDGRYRSLGYMRPLAIWAIQHALDNCTESKI